MNDRELLELSYKAANGGAILWADKDMLRHWNPLTDDGDALRLAVKLKLTIQHNHTGVFCYDSPDFMDKKQNMVEVWESDNDPYAATRRAIVRASAEIGRAM